jgi:hypothetical protein
VQTLRDCKTHFPVIIQASPTILDALESGNPENYIPRPADDLYAFVCSLFQVVANPKPSFFKTDGQDDYTKIRNFWQNCGGQKGWRRALDAAQCCDYKLLKEVLCEMFAFQGQWDAI